MIHRALPDCTLLLVDDEPANLDLLEAFLGGEGYASLVRVNDARDAVAAFEQHRPDLVLLDLHMPHASGFEVMEQLLRRVEPGDFVPVLVLTADAAPAVRARALAEGAHDFLTKPLDALEVRLRARNLLRTRLLHYEQRRATYAREQVLSFVAHDLRNPLASIGMDAEMLRHLLPADEQPVQAQAVRRIERATGRMQTLIEDLLEITRLQHGTFAIRAEPIQPNEVLREAESMLAPLARARRIDLLFDGPPALGPVRVDSERMLQVFSNLVGNAMKFTPAGGSIHVTWHTRAAELIVSIRDTGPGIPAEQLSHVFSPFWQGGSRDGGRGSGLGLGLVITRAIIDAHGGRIWLESEVGVGTTARFSIPFADAGQPHTSAVA